MAHRNIFGRAGIFFLVFLLLHVGYTIGITYIAGLCAAILREEIGKAPPLDLFELP